LLLVVDIGLRLTPETQALRISGKEIDMKQWIIQAEPFPGQTWYATGNTTDGGFTDRRERAAKYDDRDSKAVKVAYHAAVLANLGLKCNVEAVNV
jgi:hypothetical protein